MRKVMEKCEYIKCFILKMKKKNFLLFLTGNPRKQFEKFLIIM